MMSDADDDYGVFRVALSLSLCTPPRKFYARLLLSSFDASSAYYGTANGALINEYMIYHSVRAFLHVIVVIIKLTFFRHCCELPLSISLSVSLAHLLCFIIRWHDTNFEYLLISH